MFLTIFQSTPSWRGRHWGRLFRLALDTISIHALVKRATDNTIKQVFQKIKFQSTPSWRGRLNTAVHIRLLNAISIHALVKRATSHKRKPPSKADYFNPRPREEGDSFHCLYYNVPLYFNPRPREEGDLVFYHLLYNTLISIHALVKRATCIIKVLSKSLQISIHALVKRATVSSACVKCLSLNFNPRPREEGDTLLTSAQMIALHFNPRPREEGDELLYVWHSGYSISIHALVKRATICETAKYCVKSISIHALVKRATFPLTEFVPLWDISIHALVKRATSTTNVTERDLLFQSTPSWRGRQL